MKWPALWASLRKLPGSCCIVCALPHRPARLKRWAGLLRQMRPSSVDSLATCTGTSAGKGLGGQEDLARPLSWACWSAALLRSTAKSELKSCRTLHVSACIVKFDAMLSVAQIGRASCRERGDE